jgi:uncharacterized RDD family membrane protein YckC
MKFAILQNLFDNYYLKIYIWGIHLCQDDLNRVGLPVISVHNFIYVLPFTCRNLFFESKPQKTWRFKFISVIYIHPRMVNF